MPNTPKEQQVAEEEQLEAMISRYLADVADEARRALRLLTERLPSATRLVYDNYNALVVAFSPSERASESILSIAVYPSYVRLFFARGAELDDPREVLEGEGTSIRSVKLCPAERVMTDEVLSLIDAALEKARVPLPPDGEGRLVIKSVSQRQRPRRVSR